MAALLTIESQNTAKLAMYLGECRDLGVKVLAPDVNNSELAFTVTPDGVRFGLGAVKNVGEVGRPRDHRRSAAGGAHQVALPPVRAARLAPGEPARRREPRQGGRARLARAGVGRAGVAALCPRCAPGCSRPSRGRSTTATGAAGTATRARRSCSAASANRPAATRSSVRAMCRAPSRGPRRSSWRSRRNRSASTGADTRSSATHPSSRPSERRRLPSCAAMSEPAEDEEAPAAVSFEVVVGGIVGPVRSLKTRKGDRMAAFPLDDPNGIHRGGRVPGDVREGAGAHPDRHDGAGEGQVRARRRDDAAPGERDRRRSRRCASAPPAS